MKLQNLNISEIIPSIDLKNLNDGEKVNIILPTKKDQSLEIEMVIKFISQTESLVLLLFETRGTKKNEISNPVEFFSKAQNDILNRIFKISLTDLLQEIIEIGRQITISDEVVFYTIQQGNIYLKRFPINSEHFPDQVPALELSRIKEIDYWEPGRRVLSEIHRVGRLNQI